MYLLPKKIIIIKTPGALCILLPISFFLSFLLFWRWVFCLFVWCFSSQSRIFHSYGDVTLPANGCKFWPILGTYDHWAVIKGYYQVIKGYSTCHTYCDTGHPFKMVISEDPRTRDTRTCCRAFINEAVNTCLNDLGFSRLGFEHPTFNLRGERFSPLCHRRGRLRMKRLTAFTLQICITQNWKKYMFHKVGLQSL